MLVYQRVTIQKSPKKPTEHKTRPKKKHGDTGHHVGRTWHMNFGIILWKPLPCTKWSKHGGWIKVANWDKPEPQKKDRKGLKRFNLPWSAKNKEVGVYCSIFLEGCDSRMMLEGCWKSDMMYMMLVVTIGYKWHKWSVLASMTITPSNTLDPLSLGSFQTAIPRTSTAQYTDAL